MTFDLVQAVAVLERTPRVLQELLAGLPAPWLHATEGPDSWSPSDVVAHLIGGEETDWIVRARIILAQGPDRRFERFDRVGAINRSKGRPLPELLETFTDLRRENLAELATWQLTTAQLRLTGEHPEFGSVTLEQLLATWVVHDLGHLSQIARVMAKRYRADVGPWAAYLPVLTRLFTVLIVACCGATPGAVAAQSGVARPVIDKLPSGITRVMNGGPTRWTDTNGWKLVYERTVQPAEGAAGRLENPSTATLASDGRLVTLDERNPAIRLYDPAGKFLRALGRAGEGPGEYKVPFISLFRDSLFIYDPQLRRVTVMTLEGKVARTMAWPTVDYFPICFDSRGRLAVRTSKRVADGREGRWVYYTRAGVPVDSLTAPRPLDTKTWSWQQSPEGPAEWTVPFPPAMVMQLLPDGTAVYGRTDSYLLTITRTGRDTVRIFGRTNAPAIRIPAATRDSAFQAQLTKRPELAGVAKLADLPLTYPLWRSLHTDGSGNIWVRARTDRPDRSRFDVFAADGVFLGTVSGPFASAAVVRIDGDHVTVIDTDDGDLPRIRVYRIDMRGR